MKFLLLKNKRQFTSGSTLKGDNKKNRDIKK